MKALSNITFYVFAVLAVVAFIAAVRGAVHQFSMTGICAFVALISRAEYIKYRKSQ